MEILIIIVATIISFIVTYKTNKNKDIKKITTPLLISLLVLIVGLFRFDFISSDVSMLLTLLLLIASYLVKYIQIKK